MANTRPKLEAGVEGVLFASRWILAPFYLGMVLALAVILVVFVRELIAVLAHNSTMDKSRQSPVSQIWLVFIRNSDC
jgi:uncharacterized protein (TIGR00645 family)